MQILTVWRVDTTK